MKINGQFVARCACLAFALISTWLFSPAIGFPQERSQHNLLLWSTQPLLPPNRFKHQSPLRSNLPNRKLNRTRQKRITCWARRD